MEYQDKLILITGAASGIGREAAYLFAKEGGIVIVSDVNEAGGKETVDKITTDGGKAHFIKCNVADFSEVENLMSTIVSEHGRIDVAINNAGILGMPMRAADTGVDTWNQIMSVNASGVFYCMKLQLKIMLKQKGGVILNTASVAGLRGFPNNIAYSASKHAIVGMTKTAAMEYAGKNIRINALCPVFTISGMFDPEFADKFSAGLSEKLRMQVPMRRFAESSEMAEAMIWICSDKAKFITGIALPVDGGLTA